MSEPIDLLLTALALAGVFVALSGVSLTKRPSVVADRLRVLYGLLAAFFQFALVEPFGAELLFQWGNPVGSGLAALRTIALGRRNRPISRH